METADGHVLSEEERMNYIRLLMGWDCVRVKSMWSKGERVFLAVEGYPPVKAEEEDVVDDFIHDRKITPNDRFSEKDRYDEQFKFKDKASRVYVSVINEYVHREEKKGRPDYFG